MVSLPSSHASPGRPRRPSSSCRGRGRSTPAGRVTQQVVEQRLPTPGEQSEETAGTRARPFPSPPRLLLSHSHNMGKWETRGRHFEAGETRPAAPRPPPRGSAPRPRSARRRSLQGEGSPGRLYNPLPPAGGARPLPPAAASSPGGAGQPCALAVREAQRLLSLPRL